MTTPFMVKDEPSPATNPRKHQDPCVRLGASVGLALIHSVAIVSLAQLPLISDASSFQPECALAARNALQLLLLLLLL
jgi:hypothetical protein